MNFNRQALNAYKKLIETTDLQEGYQEFIKLFRFLRTELKKELPAYDFSGQIVENNMDFAYFQLTDSELKAKGIKIQVVFVHKIFRFEVWVSGYNRKIQCAYYEKLKTQTIPYVLNNNPNQVDYIIKKPLNESLDLGDGFGVLNVIKASVLESVKYIKSV